MSNYPSGMRESDIPGNDEYTHWRENRTFDELDYMKTVFMSNREHFNEKEFEDFVWSCWNSGA